MDLETKIQQFEAKFGVKYTTLLDYQTTEGDQDDDGMYHYIDLTTLNVYTYDTFDEVWLDVNINKDDILKRLKLL